VIGWGLALISASALVLSLHSIWDLLTLPTAIWLSLVVQAIGVAALAQALSAESGASAPPDHPSRTFPPPTTDELGTIPDHSSLRSEERRLVSALAMAPDPHHASDVASRALVDAMEPRQAHLLVPGLDDRLVVAGQSTARHVLTCTRPCADSCPAITEGRTISTPDNTHLDACPHLGPGATGEYSATCVPARSLGRPF